MKAALLFCSCIFIASLPQITAQQLSSKQLQATATVENALADARALHPGMTRKDVEKSFDNASFSGPSPTTYTYRKCPPIHIEVRYKLKQEAHGNTPASISPDDTIISVSRPYLDDVSLD